MTQRQAITDAILATVRTVTFPTPINGQSSFITVDSRLRLWGDVPTNEQPSAFLVTHREAVEYKDMGAVKRLAGYQLFCYSRTDNGGNGLSDLDSMLTGIESAFNIPDNYSTNNLTFNGLVYYCRIEGFIFKDPGDIDNQTLLVVPLMVRLP